MSPRELTEHDGISRRSLADFLLRACHDLRSPVRGIRAHAELMAKKLAAGDENLGFIADSARSIDLIAEGLAAYANALYVDPAGFQPVPMDVMLRNATARLANEIRERGASVTNGELPSVRGNSGLLMQLFEQLIRNAIRHSPRSSPQIGITARQEGSDWLFTVQDDGDAIDAAYLERIFKPFERLDRAKGGVGLGLAICRIIVEGHGGKIWAESAPGAGPSFRFTLPAAGQ